MHGDYHSEARGGQSGGGQCCGELMFVYICVCERERDVCVCVKEREMERETTSACAYVSIRCLWGLW